MVEAKDDFEVSYVAFAGPRSINILSKVDEKLGTIVDFGWFSSIGKALLAVLKYFYSILGNWGMAIVALTLLVRLILLPLHLMSYKSMKKMQDIQPQLKEIREKYRNLFSTR